MNYLRISFVLFLLLCVSNKTSAQNISVNPNVTAADLAQNILINSSCIDLQNISASGNPTPSGQSFGSFTAGANFPFSSGLVLSTSPSKNAEGPYIQADSKGTQIQSWNGDNDLNEALNITNSRQATVLEFDFTALTNSISFNYFFASNEYQSYYPCRYSDGFAFLIKEVGSAEDYKNLAVFPNSTTAVSATTVHPKINSITSTEGVIQGCDAQNETYFNGYNTTSSPINYAGQTVVMNAYTDVVPNKKYHLKLVIADDETRQYNSAVFIEGGSFVSKINFGEDRTAANNNPVCFGESFVLDTKLTSNGYDFKWYKKDASNNYILIPDAIGPAYAVTSSGIYKVEAALNNNTTCISVGEITVEFTPQIASTNTSLLQCDDNTDGITIFNLTKTATIVKNNNPQITNQGYYETLMDARDKSNPIVNPQAYTNKSPNQIIYARIENSYGCYSIPQIVLNISNTVIPDQSPIATCDGDEIQDGLYQFDLNSEVTPQILTGLPDGLVIGYYLTANDAITETNALPNIFKNTIPNSQTIYARAVNGPDCYDIAPIELIVHTFDPPNFEDEILYLCKGDQITLSVATGFTSYTWSNGETTNSTTVNNAGDYSVLVTDTNNCQKTKTFKVILSETAVITGAEVKDFSGVDNTVLIQYTGVGSYEFSLEGSVFQDDPTFSQVTPGIYNAVARDKNGCGLSNSFLVYVLDYPRFFTPNGDGFNDLWVIKNIDQMPDYTISIFDRYGKLLKQMTQNSSGWNGILNGQQLPSDDYWFTLQFIDGKSVKGHFSLKR